MHALGERLSISLIDVVVAVDLDPSRSSSFLCESIDYGFRPRPGRA